MQHKAKAKEIRSTNIDFPIGIPIGIWKPAKLPPISLLRVCKPNSGRRPFCRALLCQPRSDQVARTDCATGQNGGVAFLMGGDDVSSASLGREGYLRAGAGQILYFGGEKVWGNEVSCCIKDSGGTEIVRETE